jgi:hypothetical protein
MDIFARFWLSEAQLQLLTGILRTDPALERRVRKERKIQRIGYRFVLFGYLLIAGGAIALPLRTALHLPGVSLVAWALTYGELAFLTPIIVLMFHVERSYRRVGL